MSLAVALFALAATGCFSPAGVSGFSPFSTCAICRPAAGGSVNVRSAPFVLSASSDGDGADEAAAGTGAVSDEVPVSDQVLMSLTTKLTQSKKDAGYDGRSRSENEEIADAASSLPPPPRKGARKDNKAMAFLRSKGRVGGAANKNFVNAVGSDEGTTGRQPPAERDDGSGGGSRMKKSKAAYRECTASGVVDDLTEDFPLTSSGTEWRGVSDRVIGGISNGSIRRETNLEGRPCNVLSGGVSKRNGGGFIQMVADLPLDPANPSVDASEYDGIELDVICRHDPRKFNVHLRTPGTLSEESYRYTHDFSKDEGEPLADEGGAIQGGWSEWRTVRIPWSSFVGYCTGDEEPVCETLDAKELKRIGIVAIADDDDDEEGESKRGFEAFLAVAGVRFYSALDLLL